MKFTRITAIMCVLVMVTAMFAGCGETEKAKNDTETKSGKNVYMDKSKSTKERVEALMSQMTIEEKVGQMVMAEHGQISAKQIAQYSVGAMLNGGDCDPESGNTPKDWSKIVNENKAAALNSRLAIPILYGIDAIHGNSNVIGATMFPQEIGLGAANNAKLIEKVGEITALETRGIGVNYVFSPVLGEAYHESWGRFYECFSENTDRVTNLGTSYVKGFQGTLGTDDFLAYNKVVCSIKHFIGEGQTAGGANQGNVVMAEDKWTELLNSNLVKPYKEAVDAGAQTVMISYHSVNGVNCHENKSLITDLLKEKLEFKGIVISDYHGVEHCKGNTYKQQLANCVNAGVDMFMEPDDWQECYYGLVQLVGESQVSIERIDDAVTRILTVKFDSGLFEEKINSEEEKQLFTKIGSDEHREVARQAVRESATLLKNGKIDKKTTAIESLKEAKNILVVGSKADDIGIQCGGWTITWNGASGETTEGTTILEGIKEVEKGKKVKYGTDGTGVTKDTDAVIIVVGEFPYSEGHGDKKPDNLTLYMSDSDLFDEVKKAARKADNADVPVICVMLTGRPLTITDELKKMDALVCAWLPGTEGAGVADMLFGDYEFTGTTPVTWPKDGSLIENKLTDESAVRYQYGFGLKKDGSQIKY